MAEYIYSRVSTDGQSTDPQVFSLRSRFPNAEIVVETKSGVKSRPFLEALIRQLKTGDTLIVAALDRLGRKTTEILSLIEELQKREVILISVREGVDYGTPIGRLVTQILVSVAEMERNLISERTKAGLAAAREKGRQIGRKPHITDETFAKAERLIAKGMSIRKAAAAVGISTTRLAKYAKSRDIHPSNYFELERQSLEDLRVSDDIG